MLKTGIVSSAYFRYDDYEAGLIELKNDGYDCCDYHGFIHVNSPLYSYDDHELKLYLSDILKAATKCGIHFCQMHAPWPLKCATEDEISHSMELLKKSIRGSYYLDCPNIVVHTFAPFGWEKEVDAIKTFETNVKIFSEIVDYANTYGVTICIENLPFRNLEISKVDAVLKLIHAVNRSNCKMCFDVGHAHVFHDDITKDIHEMGTCLQVLHVHDNNGQFDSHLMPWQGTIDWAAFAKALKDINFSGCISLETYVDSDMPYEVKIKMRKLLSQLAEILTTI